ncbi:hypothetical protein AOQ84DRAFT_423003 [Glonium stellatum]|uniref:DUF6594 domain-containing protein n=1 Tax=Glonium stellatum TaxID=574774 RepID=A0A8E2EPV2_9PEZI|nr:hypothetical protein AOQ84DRAFT_423003 [Glonium stellatum]
MSKLWTGRSFSKAFTFGFKLSQAADSDQSPPTQKKYLEGFPSVSALLSSDPDLQVYRRFNSLASRNLLYLQAEILDLEARLEELDAADLEAANVEDSEWMEVKLSARCWEAFTEKVENGEEREVERIRLIRQIRERLAEYQDSIIRQSTILNLENPNSRVRTAITGWFAQNRPFVGHGRNLFDGKFKYDIVALRTLPDQDRLSIFLQNHLGYLFRNRSAGTDHPFNREDLYYYPDSTIRHIVSFASVLLAAVLLVGAIASLYFVTSPAAKMGLLAGFTTLFAGSIGLLTNARRVDIYAATAAYTAVLVVFIGNVGPGSSVQANSG